MVITNANVTQGLQAINVRCALLMPILKLVLTCIYIIPDALCHSGTVNSNYSGTGTMCTCPGHFDSSKDCAVCEEDGMDLIVT